jgi:hypothetical protein
MIDVSLNKGSEKQIGMSLDDVRQIELLSYSEHRGKRVSLSIRKSSC